MTSQSSLLPDPPFTPEELKVFMSNNIRVEQKAETCEEMNKSDWLSEEIWTMLLAVSNCLDGICEKISFDVDAAELMKEWFLSEKPEVCC